MKFVLLAALLPAALASYTTQGSAKATTTMYTTSYTTYMYTVYDTTSATASASYPINNGTSAAPTSTGGAAPSLPAGPTVSPSIAPVPKSGAANVHANWVVGAAVAGVVALAL
jgi:hypothetical protein